MAVAVADHTDPRGDVRSRTGLHAMEASTSRSTERLQKKSGEMGQNLKGSCVLSVSKPQTFGDSSELRGWAKKRKRKKKKEKRKKKKKKKKKINKTDKGNAVEKHLKRLYRDCI